MHSNRNLFALADSQTLNYMFDPTEVIKLSSAEPYRRRLSIKS